ncbi:aminobenzoyl-glutamate transport protein [Halobacillus karajensis]|uniref:PABA-GLU transport protein n=1 Tax=Halobacillus karajensis TaxID=195088 RepID=A0A024P5F2_9BACI|nr:AbgT family transporter [Halobacillus karajensis]CDQ17853.1 PABA-GLU transport protein [Halobacillus karajensis]CDQ24259.1 PABA-GLU transport protein [Halobacillus karajensis]CDQ29492.1 PABA-GLU transport protein [Halobacillus karajensis]SEH62755.1 aminobenzoyl-glutamate transport protein [Halobacillus karajensis]
MEPQEKKGLTMRILDWIERVGNKLPHPVTLFAIFALMVIVASWIFSTMNVEVEDPATGETLQVVNLLSNDGIQYIFESMVENFVGFAPLGTVLVTMLGIGIAERSGLISAMLRGLVTSVPRSLMTAALVFGGIMSSMAADAGYVVLTPLGAVLFAGLGRHPLAGLAAAFAGVSAGFSANLLLTSLDPLLGDLTIQAAATIDPAYADTILYTMNYYFMFVSVFVLTIVGTFVTDKLVEPRLGEYKGGVKEEVDYISPIEKKGMIGALIAFVITVGLLSLLVVPSWGPLRDPDDFLASPFFHSLVPVILIMFFIPGYVYGKITKEIKSDKDVANQMSETMASMGIYIVLAFTAGQFVAYFNHTNLGKVIAVSGAEFLDSIGFTGIGLIIAFIFVAGFINLFIGSSSAKWAIMAPVFVPLMMQLGYSPELTTLAYRIADSTTNIISPLMPYFAIVIAFAQKYDKKVGIGTLISTMLPYSIVFSIVWIIMLLIWMLIPGAEIGPGAGFYYNG